MDFMITEEAWENRIKKHMRENREYWVNLIFPKDERVNAMKMDDNSFYNAVRPLFKDENEIYLEIIPKKDFELKIGNVVIERSQNHTMTVEEITSSGIVCLWFIGNELHEDTFNPESLIFVREH